MLITESEVLYCLITFLTLIQWTTTDCMLKMLIASVTINKSTSISAKGTAQYFIACGTGCMLQNSLFSLSSFLLHNSSMNVASHFFCYMVTKLNKNDVLKFNNPMSFKVILCPIINFESA